ncbi:MAG: small ribosomal subunit Rsm22 family protein [Treponemataceae bacterium]
MNEFKNMNEQEKKVLDNFDEILQGIKKLSNKQLYCLPQNIKNLSHLLTDERSSRRNGYMNDTVMLFSYAHYFMWWNLYRLVNLFLTFPKDAFDNLSDGDCCLDLGSGPLTVITALWISRPELRSKKLVWYCMDISQNALSLGEEIFLTVVAKLKANDCCKTDSCKSLEDSELGVEPWKIIRIKGELGTKINNQIKFLTCANMFNELYYDTKMPLEEAAKRYTQSMLKYCEQVNSSSILVVEPAFPRSSRFVSLTRDALLRKKYAIIAPCLHSNSCPMDGRRGGKWCHFVFDTDHAPKKLRRLSDISSLSKDRACVSYVFASNSNCDPVSCEKIFLEERKFQKKGDTKTVSKSATNDIIKAISKKQDNNKNENLLAVRITSDKIALPGKSFGKYGCSKEGLVLVIGNSVLKAKSGDVVFVKYPEKNKIDKKSDALIVGE